MATLTGTKQVFHGDTSQVDDSQKTELGARSWDVNGNEFVYLSGVASTAAGNWVVYDESYATTLLTANEVGPVAIAMAAITADKYGWYQVFGKNTVAKTDTVAADKALYIDGTAGRADDAGVAGDLIIGAYSMTADSSNVATVFLTYPHVSDDLGAGGSGNPGGTDTQVQFNDGGSSFGGDAGMTYNKTTDTLTLAGPINMETANIEDSDASHYLVIKTTSNLTANRNFTIVPGDVARTLTMAGDINVAADFITSGANSLTLTTTGATNVTLPTTGTLAVTGNPLSQFAATTSAQLAGVISDETGSGALVFATSPTLVTPALGAATATSINGLTITSSTGTLTITSAKTFSVSNTLTLAGTDGTTMTFPSNSGNVYVSGNTDVALADGGTGASLTDPNADAMMTWDDSAGAVVFMQVGNGLNINDTPVLACDSASETVDGVVELATAAETTTGTDNTRAVTPGGLAGSNFGIRPLEEVVVDFTTDWATGDGKGYMTVPPSYGGMNLVTCHVRAITAGTTGTALVQVHNLTQAADMLTTRINLDTGETGSDTAATPYVIDTNNDDVASYDLLRIDIDAIHTTAAKGLIITLEFQLP